MITPWDFDQNMLLALNFDGGETLDFVMFWVSKTFIWIPLYVWVLWMVWRKVGLKGALVFLVVAALMVAGVEMMANLFKDHLSKFRPTHYPSLQDQVHTVNGYVGGLYGTMSAHAANTMAFIVLAGGVIRKKWLWWTLALWVAVVCYSRIYLGVHYPLDVMLGLCGGTLWGVLALWVVRGVIKKFNR